MRLSFFVLLSAGALLLGCADPIESACSKLRECAEQAGASDLEQEEQECIEQGQKQRDEAEEIDCGGEFDDYVACATDALQCKDGEIEDVEDDVCESESKAYNTCRRENRKRTACDEAAERIRNKAKECGIAMSEPTPDDEEQTVECTAELGAAAKRMADCYAGATCAGIKGENSAEATQYSQCISQ